MSVEEFLNDRIDTKVTKEESALLRELRESSWNLERADLSQLHQYTMMLLSIGTPLARSQTLYALIIPIIPDVFVMDSSLETLAAYSTLGLTALLEIGAIKLATESLHTRSYTRMIEECFTFDGVYHKDVIKVIIEPLRPFWEAAGHSMQIGVNKVRNLISDLKLNKNDHLAMLCLLHSLVENYLESGLVLPILALTVHLTQLLYSPAQFKKISESKMTGDLLLHYVTTSEEYPDEVGAPTTPGGFLAITHDILRDEQKHVSGNYLAVHTLMREYPHLKGHFCDIGHALFEQLPHEIIANFMVAVFPQLVEHGDYVQTLRNESLCLMALFDPVSANIPRPITEIQRLIRDREVPQFSSSHEFTATGYRRA